MKSVVNLARRSKRIPMVQVGTLCQNRSGIACPTLNDCNVHSTSIPIRDVEEHRGR